MEKRKILKTTFIIIILILISCSNKEELEFNSEKWKSDKIGHNNHRVKMTKNLIESEYLIGKSLDSVFELLGYEYGYLNSNLKNTVSFTIKESYGFDIDPKYMHSLIIELDKDSKKVLTVKYSESKDRRSFIEKIFTEQMLSELKPTELKLAEYMSELSEIAYTASWMSNLEFELWKGMNNHISRFGRLEFNNEIRNKLKTLSENCGGWIIYHEETEETFLSLNEWNELNE